MANLLDRFLSWLTTERGGPNEYTVEAYILERRDPDPNPRVTTYDEILSPETVEQQEEFQDGEYLLLELKTTGTVGDVIWEEELSFST